MENDKNWIIIDLEIRKALYGVKRKALRFSTEDIAIEVASQFFKKLDDFVIVNTETDLKL